MSEKDFVRERERVNNSKKKEREKETNKCKRFTTS